jgi:hypothetical protein
MPSVLVQFVRLFYLFFWKVAPRIRLKTKSYVKVNEYKILIWKEAFFEHREQIILVEDENILE